MVRIGRIVYFFFCKKMLTFALLSCGQTAMNLGFKSSSLRYNLIQRTSTPIIMDKVRSTRQVTEIAVCYLRGQEGKGWLMTATGHRGGRKGAIIGREGRPIANWRDGDNPVVAAVTR